MTVSGPEPETRPTGASVDRLKVLLGRATDLVVEFQAYNDYLRTNATQDEVEMRMFRRGLEAELEGLNVAISGKQKSGHEIDQLSDDEAEAKRGRLLQTSNVPHYEVWWSLAKQCTGVRGLGRRVILEGNDGRHRSKAKKSNPQRGQEVQVDILANDGQEWIKISTISERRLALEMAKEGWERYNDYSDSDSDDEPPNVKVNTSTEKRMLELLRLANALQEAARTVRVRYQHPRVRFILPRIIEGVNSDIDALLADVRATGATVECGQSTSPPNPAQSLEDVFARMLPRPHQPSLTPTLNIDCSILIAMISDQCHAAPSELPSRHLDGSRTYHAAILQQMAEEEASPLLPNTLYPLLADRVLTCTSEASSRMLNIVSMMGTDPERQRAAIILGHGSFSTHSPASLLGALQTLSSHPLPTDPAALALPIRVVDVSLPALTTNTTTPAPTPSHSVPSVFHRLRQTTKLSTLNAAVLLYGWSHDLVTLTSNQTAVNQVERGINAVLDEMERSDAAAHFSALAEGGARGVCREAEGKGGRREGEDVVMPGAQEGGFHAPRFWVVQGCRSLVGKEKEKGNDALGETKWPRGKDRSAS